MLSDRCHCLSVCRSVVLVYYGQTVAWIKMSLGTEVDLAPGHIVLDGDPPRAAKGAHQPRTFRHMSVVAKRSPISVTAELFFLNDSLLLSSLVDNIHYTVIPHAGVRPMKVFFGGEEKIGLLKVVISLYNLWLGQCIRTLALGGTA